MPNPKVLKRHLKLRALFGPRLRSGELLKTVADDPHYPTFFLFDDSEDPHLSQALGTDQADDRRSAADKARDELPAAEGAIRGGPSSPSVERTQQLTSKCVVGEEETDSAEILGDQCDYDGHTLIRVFGETKTALFSPPPPSSGVVQMSRLPQTREATSVVGRAGVIDIIIERMRMELDRLGANINTNQLTIGDLARIVADADEPSNDQTQAHAKFLRRLNIGRHVAEARTAWLEAFLGLPRGSLYFCNPAVYKDAATRKRAALKRAPQRKTVFLTWKKLDLNMIGAVSMFLRLVKRSHAHFSENPIEDGAQADVKDAVAELKLAMELVSAPEARVSIEAIHHAVQTLLKLNVVIWFATYKDREPVGPDDHERRYSSDVKSRTIRRMEIILARSGDHPPDRTVDLSHTIGMGPTLDDLMGGPSE